MKLQFTTLNQKIFSKRVARTRCAGYGSAPLLNTSSSSDINWQTIIFFLVGLRHIFLCHYATGCLNIQGQTLPCRYNCLNNTILFIVNNKLVIYQRIWPLFSQHFVFCCFIFIIRFESIALIVQIIQHLSTIYFVTSEIHNNKTQYECPCFYIRSSFIYQIRN